MRCSHVRVLFLSLKTDYLKPRSLDVVSKTTNCSIIISFTFDYLFEALEIRYTLVKLLNFCNMKYLKLFNSKNQHFLSCSNKKSNKADKFCLILL